VDGWHKETPEKLNRRGTRDSHLSHLQSLHPVFLKLKQIVPKAPVFLGWGVGLLSGVHDTGRGVGRQEINVCFGDMV
jgi:hypothetical protein